MAGRLLVSRLMLLSLLIAIGLGGIVTNQLLSSRTAILEHAQITNQNILFTVSHVLENTLSALDLSLRDTVDRIERTTSGHNNFSTLQGAALSTRLLASVDVGNELVLDEAGGVVYATKSLPPGDWSFAKRDYFLAHELGLSTGLFVGRPFYSQLDGRMSVAFSRRWNWPDGTFGGVVVLTIKLQHFRELFSSIELGNAGGINLYLTDGTLLTRFPYNEDQFSASLAEKPNYQRFRSEGHGSFTGPSDIDGVDRLFTFSGLEPFPFLVAIVRSTDVILQGWYSNVRWLGAATFILMLACMALALRAEHQLHARHLATAQMQRAKNDLHTVLDGLPAMVAYWDRNLLNRFSNTAHTNWFGRKQDELDGLSLEDLLGEKLFKELGNYFHRALDGHGQQFENTLIDLKGNARHVVSTYIPDFSQHGTVRGFFVLATDTTERKQIETSLFEEKERFRVTLESIKDGVITTDKDGRITYQNPAARFLTGWAPQEALGRFLDDIIVLQDTNGEAVQQSSLQQTLLSAQVVTSINDRILINRDGKHIEVDDAAAPILDEQGRLSGAVVVLHDVSRTRAVAREMQYMAEHDPLTMLPNRRRLDVYGNRAIARARRSGARVAVLYLDLDGFKNINDTYGHDAGDELLVTVAQRFSAVLRESDILSRHGGDEFIVLMEVLDGPDDFRRLAERLLAVSHEAVQVRGELLSITASIGIGLFPDDADDFEGLLRHADKSMYEAKRKGKNRYAFVT